MFTLYQLRMFVCGLLLSIVFWYIPQIVEDKYDPTDLSTVLLHLWSIQNGWAFIFNIFFPIKLEKMSLMSVGEAERYEKYFNRGALIRIGFTALSGWLVAQYYIDHVGLRFITIGVFVIVSGMVFLFNLLFHPKFLAEV